MTENEWQPLPPEERKKAEERLKKDKVLLDRAFKKGQFTSEYCVEKVNELKVKYGLAPSVWTEKEAQDFDTELDAALEEGAVVEEHEWTELPPEERKRAEKKLLREKKMLNKAYKLGKISREKCATKIRVVEVELGLAPPPTEASEQEFQKFLESEAHDDPLFEDLDDDEEDEVPEPEGLPPGDEEPEERPLDDEEPEERPLDDDIEEPKEEWDPGTVGGNTEDEEVTETVEELSLDDEIDELEELSLDDEIDELEELSLDDEVELEDLSLDDDTTPEEPLAEQVYEDTEEEETIAEDVSEDVAEEEEPVDEPESEETDPREQALTDLRTVPGIGKYKAGILYDAGFRSHLDIQEAGYEELSQIKHIGPKTARIIIDSLGETSSEPDAKDETVEPEEVTTEEEYETQEETEELLAVEDELVSEEMKIGKGLLIVGIVLCLMGTFGVVGLRLGYIQNLLGDPIPYPGIGYAEPVGHVVSIIPFVIGLVTIIYWGIKNDPIYYERELLIEEKDELEEEVLEPEEVEKPPEPEMAAEPPIEHKEPEPGFDESMDDLDRALQEENERREYCEKMLEAVYILPDDRERLNALLHTSITKEDFIEEIKTAVARKKESETEDEELQDELAALGEFEEPDEDDSFEESILKDLEDL